MVFKFRLLSHEIKDFVRDIEIKSSQTFFDLHKAIQDDLNYDSSQIASFFLTNQNWEKEMEFILFDMSDVPNASMIAMDRARLRDYVKDPKQRLIYIFDVFNERGLFIELIDSQNELKYFDYPAVVFSKGAAPQQILFGNRDYGAILGDDNAVFNFGDDYDETAKEGLPGELDTNEGDDFDEDSPTDFDGEGGENAFDD
ncbi:MAG: hypothetical protein H6540_05035 [Bacteroidales bacterium]|nr:hypothetical protein [Bacteroidales bacterium]